jgi:hypothetical protein
MFPGKSAARIRRIADAWSRALKLSGLPVSVVDLQILIEEALWRGEFPRHCHRRFGWAMGSIEWYVNWPDGDPRAWTDADLVEAGTYEDIADAWRRPDDPEMIAADNPSPLVDVVLTPEEINEWRLAHGHEWPGFWGPRSRTIESAVLSDSQAVAPLRGPTQVKDDRVGSVSGNKPGPPPIKLQKVISGMQAAITAGTYTPDELRKKQQKDLVAQFGVSRDTAQRARRAVLEAL